MGDMFSERKLTVHDISLHVHGDTAWAKFYWDFAAKFRNDGSPLTTHGRETQLYRREQGRWRLVHVHHSGMVDVKDRKSTRLNSSHLGISYAVFCLKKKKRKEKAEQTCETRHE